MESYWINTAYSPSFLSRNHHVREVHKHYQSWCRTGFEDSWTDYSNFLQHFLPVCYQEITLEEKYLNIISPGVGHVLKTVGLNIGLVALCLVRRS